MSIGQARGCYDKTRPLAIMHVPKSSGTSLTRALVEATHPVHAMSGFDRCLFGTFDAFSSFAPDLEKIVYRSFDALTDADFIAGHFSFSTLQQRYKSAQFLTVLREPVSRLLSHWLFWRGHDDERLEPWGAWAAFVRLARQPLADFLHAPGLACQNDNQTVRMLLWPHKRIPDGGFIDPRDDALLVSEAKERLWNFDFINIVENPALAAELQTWLNCPVRFSRDNETTAVPQSLRGRLEDELTPQATERLTQLTRIDRQLWHEVADRVLPGEAIARLRERTLMTAVARYSRLLSGQTSGASATRPTG